VEKQRREGELLVTLITRIAANLAAVVDCLSAVLIFMTCRSESQSLLAPMGPGFGSFIELVTPAYVRAESAVLRFAKFVIEIWRVFDVGKARASKIDIQAPQFASAKSPYPCNLSTIVILKGIGPIAEPSDVLRRVLQPVVHKTNGLLPPFFFGRGL
jgi:hypothetical protein